MCGNYPEQIWSQCTDTSSMDRALKSMIRGAAFFKVRHLEATHTWLLALLSFEVPYGFFHLFPKSLDFLKVTKMFRFPEDLIWLSAVLIHFYFWKKRTLTKNSTGERDLSDVQYIIWSLWHLYVFYITPPCGKKVPQKLFWMFKDIGAMVKRSVTSKSQPCVRMCHQMISERLSLSFGAGADSISF